MRLLSNTDVEQVIDMKETIDVLDKAYAAWGDNSALNRPRSDMVEPKAQENRAYIFKTMDGLVPEAGVAAVRINSDIIQWYQRNGVTVKDRLPTAKGKRWNAFMLVFSTETGELIGILPDGVLQKTRVAATCGLGAKYLARQDAEVVGLLGSGWQASAQVLAYCAVRNIKQIKVFSPTQENRERFAREMNSQVEAEVVAVSSAEEAVRQSHIVATVTNAIDPVFDADWLEPGSFVTCVKHAELGEKVFRKMDAGFINTRETEPLNYIIGQEQQPIRAHDPAVILTGEVAASASKATTGITFDWRGLPELRHVIAGKQLGRTDDKQIVAFINNIGLGLQFAAVSSVVLKKAEEQGIGRELPGEWFSSEYQ